MSWISGSPDISGSEFGMSGSPRFGMSGSETVVRIDPNFLHQYLDSLDTPGLAMAPGALLSPSFIFKKFVDLFFMAPAADAEVDAACEDAFREVDGVVRSNGDAPLSAFLSFLLEVDEAWTLQWFGGLSKTYVEIAEEGDEELSQEELFKLLEEAVDENSEGAVYLRVTVFGGSFPDRLEQIGAGWYVDHQVLRLKVDWQDDIMGGWYLYVGPDEVAEDALARGKLPTSVLADDVFTYVPQHFGEYNVERCGWNKFVLLEDLWPDLTQAFQIWPPSLKTSDDLERFGFSRLSLSRSRLDLFLETKNSLCLNASPQQ